MEHNFIIKNICISARLNTIKRKKVKVLPSYMSKSYTIFVPSAAKMTRYIRRKKPIVKIYIIYIYFITRKY